MTVIGTNIASIRAANASSGANATMQTAMERLSTGKRINSSKDDAAGMAIVSSMTSSIRGMSQAVRNANDGISLAQTAEGTLGEVSNMLQRIRELAVQSASGTYSDGDRTNLQAEVTQLTSQIKQSLGDAEFNGVKLFDTAKGGSGVSLSIQVGSKASQTVTLSIGNLDTSSFDPVAAVEGKEAVEAQEAVEAVPEEKMSADGTYTVKAGDDFVGKTYTATQDDEDNGTIGGSSPTAGQEYTLAADDVIYLAADTVTTTGVEAKEAVEAQDAVEAVAATPGLDVTSAANATAALGIVDTFLTSLNTVRAGIGAAQSRLGSVVTNLTNNVTSLTDARSRIEDADFSVETANLAKAQILSQASTAMLAQANQSKQSVLQLLQ
ncbi:MAG: flagellin [Sphingomonas sp.]|nr:flagellin [Sphingomonas sp.]